MTRPNHFSTSAETLNRSTFTACKNASEMMTMIAPASLRILMVVTSLFGMTGVVLAQPPKDEKAKDEKALAEDFRAFAKGEATAYTFRLEGSKRR